MVKKLIVIGLDGATFKLLKPWAEAGYLPAIKKIFDSGVSGELRSTVPSMTAPAWSALATGKNPGKTGIYDFFNRTNSSYEFKIFSNAQLRGKCFWDYLGNSGKTVAILSYPLMYPTYPVNGIMVSGFGGTKSGEWAYPPTFSKRIGQVSPSFCMDLDLKAYKTKEKYLRAIDESFTSQKKIFEDVIEKNAPMCTVFVISMTDWVQHAFWKDLDADYPNRDAKQASLMKEKVLSFYKKVDSFLGGVIENHSHDSNIFIVSDHGFGPLLMRFNLERWLVREGYIKLKSSGGTQDKPRTFIYNSAKEMMRLLKLKELFPDLMNALIPSLRLKLSPTLNQIDFAKSKAYILSSSSSAIYLNIKGRDEKGFIERADYEEVVTELVKKLETLKEEFPEIDSVETYKSTEIYSGPKTQFAPDVMLKLNGGSFNYSTSMEGSMIQDVSSLDFPFPTGNHRREGIFMAYGPDIKKSYEVNGANIEDVMPTILFMFGHKIPEEVDGKVLEIFSEDSELYGKNPKKETKKIVPGEKRLKLLKEKLQKRDN